MTDRGTDTQLSAVLLGTGNPLPDPNRAGSATLVRAGGRSFLVDCGRGVCMRMAAARTIPLLVEAVFLTHLHSDHICDLNDVITTHWVMSQKPTELSVFGPPGTQAVVDACLAMLGADIGYRLAHHEDLTWRPQISVTEVSDGLVLERDGVSVLAGATDHRPVDPSVGYRFDYAGRAVVVAGDTVPCPGLDELCRDADVYIQTVLREDLVRSIPVQRFIDTIDYHSTVEQAAQTAARAGAKTLVLTHQVPSPSPGTDQEWIALARRHFSGRIVFGEDLTAVA